MRNTSQFIVGIMKPNRLQWLEHLGDGRETKQIYKHQRNDQRPRGRPRTKWIDCVTKNLHQVSITNWKEQVQNRAEWRRIVSADKVSNAAEKRKHITVKLKSLSCLLTYHWVPSDLFATTVHTHHRYIKRSNIRSKRVWH